MNATQIYSVWVVHIGTLYIAILILGKNIIIMHFGVATYVD